MGWGENSKKRWMRRSRLWPENLLCQNAWNIFSASRCSYFQVFANEVFLDEKTVKRAHRFPSFQQSHAWPGTQATMSFMWMTSFLLFEVFWNDVFLKEIKQKFSISHEQLDGVGSSIKFLRRTMTEVNDDLVITPGTRIEKLVRLFESFWVSTSSEKHHVTHPYNCLTTHPSLIRRIPLPFAQW